MIPVPGGYPGETRLPTVQDFKDAYAEARRRAQEVRREVERGEYGSAAGHLLLGQPFPAAGDEPGQVLNNESAGPVADPPPEAESELGAQTKALENLLEQVSKGGLDEGHLQAAENDRQGRPVTREDGKKYDHEMEVGENLQRLDNSMDQLRRKLQHEQSYGRRPTNEEIDRVEKAMKRAQDLLDEVNKRLPGVRGRIGKPRV